MEPLGTGLEPLGTGLEPLGTSFGASNSQLRGVSRKWSLKVAVLEPKSSRFRGVKFRGPPLRLFGAFWSRFGASFGAVSSLFSAVFAPLGKFLSGIPNFLLWAQKFAPHGRKSCSSMKKFLLLVKISSTPNLKFLSSGKVYASMKKVSAAQTENFSRAEKFMLL